MKFENFIKEASIFGGGKSKPLRLEKSIVNVWNYGKDSQNKDLEDISLKVVNYLKSRGVKGRAEHFGSSPEKTSSLWVKNGGSRESDPKTDIIIGNLNISIKTKGAQLSSGGRSESKSVFLSVLDGNPDILSLLKNDEMFSRLMKSFDNYASGKLPSTVSKSREEKNTKILKYDVWHDKVTTALNTFFEENTDLKKLIIKEMLSGEVKFGGNKRAIATHLLYIDMKDGESYLGSLDNDTLINKIAAKSSFKLSFKSYKIKDSEMYSYYTALRTKINEGFIDTIKDYFSRGLNFFFKDVLGLTFEVMIHIIL